MKHEQIEGRNWASAVGGALLLSVVTAFVSALAIGIYSTPSSLMAILACGAAIGLVTGAIMLWLFSQRQILAHDIWKSICDLWDAWGKHGP